MQARRQPSPGGVPGHTALHGDPQKGPRVTQPQHWGRALRGSLCPPSRRAGATGMQPGTFQMLLSQSPRSRTRKEAARGFSFLFMSPESKKKKREMSSQTGGRSGEELMASLPHFVQVSPL